MRDSLLLQRELMCRFQREYVYKNTIYESVKDVRKELRLVYPLMPCEIETPLEPYVRIENRYLENTKLCGLIDKALPPRKSKILINMSNPVTTRRFSFYHEVCHWFFHPAGKVYHSIKGMRENGIEDYQANEAAAEIMLPYKLFIPWLGDKLNRRPEFTYARFCRMRNDAIEAFQISPAMFKFRVEGLKYEIYQYLNGRDINDIKIMSVAEQRRKGIYIDSLNWAGFKRLPYVRISEAC